MHCPFCAHDDTKVNDSRLAAHITYVHMHNQAPKMDFEPYSASLMR